MVPSLPPARPRFLLVVILTILGGVLRFKSFGQLGLSHIDEGIYALAGAWAIAPGGLSALDPMVIPYAPPVFPILVGLSYGLFGISDGSAIVVSILCGVATIPVVAWLAWHTFGAGADTTGAALAALALAHIALSRKALNDAPFLLAWLVAIGLGGRFLEGPRFGRALALGLAVGIAQNLKYNGWLAGSLVVLTALFGLAVRREGPTRGATLRTFGWGGCAALVAALLYRPWFEFVERLGGYSALMSHHREYPGGASVWWTRWNQQLAQAFALSGAVPWRLSTWTAIVLTCAVGDRGRRLVAVRGWRGWFRLFLVLVPGGLVISILPNLSWWIGLGWVPWLLRAERPSARLLGAWWLVLSVLTPFYHPYARLWLPLHACGWLLLARLLVHISPFAAPAQGIQEAPSAPVVGPSGRIGRSVALVCLALASLQEWANPPNILTSDWILDPEPTLRRIVQDDLRRDPRRQATIRILARRPVLLYLLLEKQTAIRLEPGLGSLASEARRTEVLVLDEAMFGEGSSSARVLDELWPFWKAERDFPDQLDPVTLLDVKPSAAVHHPWSPSRGNRLLLLTPEIPPRLPRSRQLPPIRTRTPP